jgi:phosphatidylinositol kinase/protein kinase (PI-3  family)
MALQAHAEKIIVLVEMMMLSLGDLPCFEGGEETVRSMKERFFPTGKRMAEPEAHQHVVQLIDESLDNWRTVMYDKVQNCCQGIV